MIDSRTPEVRESRVTATHKSATSGELETCSKLGNSIFLTSEVTWQNARFICTVINAHRPIVFFFMRYRGNFHLGCITDGVNSWRRSIVRHPGSLVVSS